MLTTLTGPDSSARRSLEYPGFLRHWPARVVTRHRVVVVNVVIVARASRFVAEIVFERTPSSIAVAVVVVVVVSSLEGIRARTSLGGIEHRAPRASNRVGFVVFERVGRSWRLL